MRPPAVLLAMLAFIATSSAYYGATANDYEEGDQVPLTVNALTSRHSVIPYGQYDERFQFCPPNDGINSPFDLKMNKNTTCNLLCTASLKSVHANFLIARIQEKYYFNWLVDSLPAAQSSHHHGVDFMSMGLVIGDYTSAETSMMEAKPKIYNHYVFLVDVFETEEESYRVVGAAVYGFSKAYSLSAKGFPNCEERDLPLLFLSHDSPISITYTYDVRWRPSTLPWATRWDSYLQVYDPKIHWYSLTNSFSIVLFLTTMMCMTLLRSLRKDISRYSQESLEDESGWKLIHGDVFRTPSSPLLLSVLVGNGVHIFLMSCIILAMAMLGFFSPSTQGNLMTVFIGSYVCFGFFAGYASARMYKMLSGETWRRCMVLTATLVPGILSLLLLLLNFLMGAHTSAVMPFSTLAGLLGLWILISCPLSFVGAYLGFKKARVEYPVRVYMIPSRIPPQAFYLQRLPSILLGGVLPFGIIFIELYFMLGSVWFNRIFQTYGYLSLVFLLVMLTCCEVTVLLCYFHLCTEDYHWWWRAFFTSGSSAFYAFFYCTFYYLHSLKMSNEASFIFYFGWTAVMCTLFFILTGTAGFLASLWFLRKIYSIIRID